MSAAPTPVPGTVRGPVCPTVGRPLAQLDGGLARVRVPGGRLAADGLRALAGAAAEHGNGVLEVTNRANVQLRGVAEPAALPGAIEAAGLSAGEAGDRRRSVVVAPLAGLDGTPDVDGLLADLLAALGAADLDGLSPKWGASIDTGGPHGLAGRRDDVVVAVGTGAVEVRADGTTWSGPPDDPAAVAAAVVGAARGTLGRPRRPVATGGHQAAAGPVGAAPRWVGAQPWLGRLDPSAALAVADAAERHAGGAVRLTPWRGVVLPLAGPGALADLAAAGLLTDPADPAVAVVACAGPAGCPAALADVQVDAAAVAAGRRQAGRLPLAVHVSGCAKRCAHPAPAGRTLVAVAPGRYDVFDGADRPLATDLPASAAVEQATR